MAVTTVAPIPPEEEIRHSLENAALNLRGIAAALRMLYRDHLDDAQTEAINILYTLAQAVEIAADVMSDAEDFLRHEAVA